MRVPFAAATFARTTDVASGFVGDLVLLSDQNLRMGWVVPCPFLFVEPKLLLLGWGFPRVPVPRRLIPDGQCARVRSGSCPGGVAPVSGSRSQVALPGVSCPGWTLCPCPDPDVVGRRVPVPFPG
eukprot:gene25314-biopygen20967